MRNTKSPRGRWIAIASTILLGLPGLAVAQGTAVDYARANGLRVRYESATTNLAGPATWIGNTNRFWYRRLSKGVNEFIIVDAQTLQKQPAFDREKIATSLSKFSGKTYKPEDLPLISLRFDNTNRRSRLWSKKRRYAAPWQTLFTPSLTYRSAGRETSGRSVHQMANGKQSSTTSTW
jgi:hypothetical protein